MENINKTIKCSLIESESQLTDIYGGIGLPIGVFVKLAEWAIDLNNKIEDWIESKL